MMSSCVEMIVIVVMSEYDYLYMVMCRCTRICVATYICLLGLAPTMSNITQVNKARYEPHPSIYFIFGIVHLLFFCAVADLRLNSVSAPHKINIVHK